MNLLLVNPVHPSTPHISAVRAWRFALALSAKGHRVAVLTAVPAGGNASASPTSAKHDWCTPLVIAPTRFVTDPPAPHGAALIRKIRTAWQLLRHGGHQSDWVDSAVAAVAHGDSGFRPDAIWAIYGKMEAVFVAKRLSLALGVPWVLDLKDNWELFVPPLLRNVMARRIGGWSAITANAPFTDNQARRWHGVPATVVYSGVDDAFFGRDRTDCANPAAEADFVINLVGSLYYSDKLRELLEGIAGWSRHLSKNYFHRVELRYLGGDVEMFQRSIDVAGLDLRWRAEGYLPIESMALAARSAAVNMYVMHDGSFHHKLLELLASGRPVLAYPCETAESRALAMKVQGELIEPENPAGVARAFDTLHRRWRTAPRCHARSGPDLCENYSWDSQARLLEEVLIHAARP